MAACFKGGGRLNRREMFSWRQNPALSFVLSGPALYSIMLKSRLYTMGEAVKCFINSFRRRGAFEKH